MILSHSFHFVKCGYAVFSPFFCGFCHLSHRPGTTSGVARKIGTGDARGKDKRLLFSVSGGKSGRRVVARIFPSTLVSRSLSTNAPGGRPYSPENARSPFPLCRGDHPSPARLARTSCPHVLPARLPRQTTCKRGRRRGASLETGFIRRPDSIGRSGSAFHDASPRRESRFSCAPRYSAARTMRSGYTLLVRSVDPSGQIMSRAYPSSPNVTGISTVRVS